MNLFEKLWKFILTNFRDFNKLPVMTASCGSNSIFNNNHPQVGAGRFFTHIRENSPESLSLSLSLYGRELTKPYNYLPSHSLSRKIRLHRELCNSVSKGCNFTPKGYLFASKGYNSCADGRNFASKGCNFVQKGYPFASKVRNFDTDGCNFASNGHQHTTEDIYVSR
jgi:hypothetical protein